MEEVMENTENSAVPASPDYPTLIMLCPVCESDAAETLGVTGAMDRSPDATVIMQCGDCDTVYLSPPPSSAGSDDDSTLRRVYEPVINDVKQSVPANRTFVSADTTESSILGRSGEQIDRIALPLTLESSADPKALLEHARGLLADGGQLQIVVGNVGSSCFRAFRGRHWCGYRYPAANQYFALRSIEDAAKRAQLRVSSSRTAASAHAWLLSLRNLLEDWNAPRVVVALLTGRWLIPWAVASLVESVAAMRGRGAVLVAQIESDEGDGHDDG